jgi:hypothetical protein
MHLYDESNNAWIEHRKTEEYKRRKNQVKNAWIVVGIVLAMLPVGLCITFAVFLGFMSLSYLDELPYSELNIE